MASDKGSEVPEGEEIPTPPAVAPAASLDDLDGRIAESSTVNVEAARTALGDENPPLEEVGPPAKRGRGRPRNDSRAPGVPSAASTVPAGRGIGSPASPVTVSPKNHGSKRTKVEIEAELGNVRSELESLRSKLAPNVGGPTLEMLRESNEIVQGMVQALNITAQMMDAAELVSTDEEGKALGKIWERPALPLAMAMGAGAPIVAAVMQSLPIFYPKIRKYAQRVQSASTAVEVPFDPSAPQPTTVVKTGAP